MIDVNMRLMGYNLIEKHFSEDFPNHDYIFLLDDELLNYLKTKNWQWSGKIFYNLETRRKFTRTERA